MTTFVVANRNPAPHYPLFGQSKPYSGINIFYVNLFLEI